MKSNKLNITVDSNVFRDLDFIEWLQINSDSFEIYLSIIVYLETYHWYNLRGLDRKLFDNDIQALNPTILELKISDVESISKNVVLSKLLFKHHVRDIIIGTHVINNDCLFITYNIKHFQWMKNKPLTPDEFIQYYTTN